MSTTSALPSPQTPEEDRSQPYSALPAKELLSYVQVAGAQLSDPEAQLIFTAFYRRYYRYLYRVVSNSLGYVYDADAQREIIDDALAAFFRGSHKLAIRRGATDEDCDRIVRSYLGKLAKWKVSYARSFHQAFGRDTVDAAVLEEMLNGNPLPSGLEEGGESGGNKAEARVAAVREWMGSLRPLEQDILRTYFIDTHLGQKSDRLPSGVAALLAKKHNTTTSNIRHLKSKLEQQVWKKFRDL